jgi:hypothetical protein
VLLALMGAAAGVGACAPPGGELADRATRATGERSQQLAAPVPRDARRCRVRPPDVALRDLTFGFARSENNDRSASPRPSRCARRPSGGAWSSS